MTQRLSTGQRIYNGGDQANPDHFGTITEVRDDKWGLQYEITPDDYTQTAHDRPYWIPACMFSATYSGNGSTRFVTEQAYNEYRQARLDALKARLSA
jgi:hypothetical protein